MYDILWKSLEIFGIVWGGPTMLIGFMRIAACYPYGDRKQGQRGMMQVLLSAAAVIAGLASPGCVNWLPAGGMSSICHLSNPQGPDVLEDAHCG